MRRHRNGQSRRWWRRLERKAIVAHERDLLDALQQFAEERSPCRVSAEGANNPAGVLRLLVSQQQLLMAGVLPAQRRELTVMQAGGPLLLTAGGRYGQLWWITLTNGHGHTVIAGSRVRFCGDSGGTVLAADGTRIPPYARPLPGTVHIA
jgi:hypothetical protein